MENGADLGATDKTLRYTPLHEACASGHLEVVKFLVEMGADVGVTDCVNGYTPLDEAVAHNHTEIVKYLTKLIKE